MSMLPIPANLGKAGAGLGNISSILRELQGLDIALLTTVAADTWTTVANLGDGDQIVKALSVKVDTGVLTLATPSVTDRRHGIKASGTITVSGTVAADATVTVNGVTFTAKATPTLGTHFLASATVNSVALSLKNAINSYFSRWTGAGSNGFATPVIVATVSSGVVTITAKAVGTAGNSYTLAKVGSNLAVSGANLSGGNSTNQIKFAAAHDNIVLFYFRKAGA